MISSKIIFISSALALALVGCAKSSSSAAAAVASLSGTWLSNCVLSDNAYQKNNIVFSSGNSAKYNLGVYGTDSTCSAANLEFNIISTATYTIGAAGPVSGSYQVNIVYSDFTITPATTAVAQALNGGSYCGITAWSAGTATDITGKTCSGAVLSNGQTDYNLFAISGTSLNFGDETGANNGSTAALRPTTIYSTTTYTQQ